MSPAFGSIVQKAGGAIEALFADPLATLALIGFIALPYIVVEAVGDRVERLSRPMRATVFAIAFGGWWGVMMVARHFTGYPFWMEWFGA